VTGASLDGMGALPILAWVFTGLLLVLLLVALAAGRGAIPVNHFVGIRLPPLERSDTAWQLGHRAAVAPTTVAFVVALVFAVIGLAVPALDVVVVFCFVVGLIWSMVAAVRAARTGEH
jgi:hypothetical protein